MENCCLAIPKVPVQQWNQTYDLATALAEGTIFPELNMPFFAAPEKSNTTLCGKKQGVMDTVGLGEDAKQLLFMQVCFALDDTLLYLDTHPEDVQAKQFYETCLQKKKELLAQNSCGCDCLTHFEWEKKPLVWEGGHC